MPGIGSVPIGSIGIGYAPLTTLAATPSSPLPDPRTGLSQTGRLINPLTKDYVMQSDGRLQGMPTVNQLVLIAVFNLDFSSLTEKGPNFANALRAIIQNGMAYLVTQKLVAIRQIVIQQPNADAGLALMNWTDLTTGQNQQTPVGAS